MQIFHNLLRRIIRFLKPNFLEKLDVKIFYYLILLISEILLEWTRSNKNRVLLILWICRFNRPADGGPELYAQAGQDWQDRTQDCRRKAIERTFALCRVLLYLVVFANISSFHLSSKCWTHKVHLYLEYHSVCSLVRMGLPHPLSRKRVRWWGGPNSDDWRKSLVLCLLCG